jgi:endonuclease/exonuclease/phosphatase family metal-dependent hydrolase
MTMRFRVLTYNIHKAIGVDREFEPDRIVDILGHHDADVVMLQEVDRGVPRSRRLDIASYIARHLQYQYRAVGMNVFFKEGKYGNATLSRFPIGRQRNINLTVGNRKRRGAQHTRIRLVGGRREIYLDLFNIHLSLTAHLRRKQVRRLLASRDMTQLLPQAPVIVGGDTNDWRGSLQRRYFGPAGFRCATNRRPGSRRSIHTFPSFAPTTGLDKLFFRGELRLLRAARSRLKLARVASDHLPVLADFELSSEARPRRARS